MMNRIPFTRVGLDKIIAERDKFQSERPDTVSHLQKAREMGDLSENGYYKESRARLSFIDSRLRYLERIIKAAEVITPTRGQMIGFGSQVKLTDGQKESEYTLVGSFEANPNLKTISAQSPLGKTLMGKKTGDQVIVTTPGGTTNYKILKVNV